MVGPSGALGTPGTTGGWTVPGVGGKAGPLFCGRGFFGKPDGVTGITRRRGQAGGVVMVGGVGSAAGPATGGVAGGLAGTFWNLFVEEVPGTTGTGALGVETSSALGKGFGTEANGGGGEAGTLVLLPGKRTLGML